MMLRKMIPGLLLLAGLALAGGCLSPVEERTVRPVNMSVSTSTPTVVNVVAATPTPRPRAPDTSTLAPAPIPGYPAPDFALPDLEGNELRLSDLRGQVVLLNFWTTW